MPSQFPGTHSAGPRGSHPLVTLWCIPTIGLHMKMCSQGFSVHWTLKHKNTTETECIIYHTILTHKLPPSTGGIVPSISKGNTKSKLLLVNISILSKKKQKQKKTLSYLEFFSGCHSQWFLALWFYLVTSHTHLRAQTKVFLFRAIFSLSEGSVSCLNCTVFKF